MRSIVIVGGGFSGTMVAVHLLRAGARVTLLDRTGRFGCGAAYGTDCLEHLLNVPAARMSAYPDRPEHFLQWARALDPQAQGGSFLPRRWYGRYIAEQLESEASRAGDRLSRIHAEAVALSLDPDHKVRLEYRDPSGRPGTIEAGAAVLALGNYAPSDPPIADGAFYSSDRYIRDPWGPRLREPGSRTETKTPEDVLLIGTGLTMLDIALELASDPGVGVIHAISRRGLLPEPHRAPGKPAHYDPPASAATWPGSALGMLRGLRAEVRAAAAEGIDWREVVTSIRPITSDLWKRLPVKERARFLRRIRPYWEVVRHRSAPQPFAALQKHMDSGRVMVHAGRLLAMDGGGPFAAVSFRPRGAAAGVVRGLRVGRVINCTGPEGDCRRLADPFMQALLSAGLVKPDALGLGLDSTDEGALLNAAGHPSDRLWLTGPLRKATLWEATAVPELREHAAALAALLTRG